MEARPSLCGGIGTSPGLARGFISPVEPAFVLHVRCRAKTHEDHMEGV